MYYICEKRTQKLENLYGIRDTDDNVVEYYTPRDIIHFIKELNIPIQGVSQDETTKRWTFTVMNFTATSEDVGFITENCTENPIDIANNLPISYPTGLKLLTNNSIEMTNFVALLNNLRGMLAKKVDTHLTTGDNNIKFCVPMKDAETHYFDKQGKFIAPFEVGFHSSYLLKGVLAYSNGARLVFCYSYSAILCGEFILFTEGGSIPYLGTSRQKGQIYKGIIGGVVDILSNKIVAEKSTDKLLSEDASLNYLSDNSLEFVIFCKYARVFHDEYVKLFGSAGAYTNENDVRLVSIIGDVADYDSYDGNKDSQCGGCFKVAYRDSLTAKIQVIRHNNTVLYFEMLMGSGEEDVKYRLSIAGSDVESFGFTEAGNIMLASTLVGIKTVVYRTTLFAKKRKEFLLLCEAVKDLVPKYDLPNYKITVKDRGSSEELVYNLCDLPIFDIEFVKEHPIISLHIASTDYIRNSNIESEEVLYLSLDTMDCTFILSGNFTKAGISAFESVGFPKGFLRNKYRITAPKVEGILEYIKSVKNHPEVAQKVD